MLFRSILGAAVLKIAVAENNFATHHENKLQAYYLARSGALSVAEYMVRDAVNDAHELVDKTSEWNEQISGGRFRVETESVPSSSDIDIISTGEYRGIRQQTKIRVTGSSTGIGGILQHAIAAKEGISTANDNGNGLYIDGSIATKGGGISLGDKGVASGTQVTDPNLIFPPIILPPDRSPAVGYNLIFNDDVNTKSYAPTVETTKLAPTYISAGNITLEKKDKPFKVTGDGVAHLYAQGNLLFNPDGWFDVASTAKLYVYVVGERTVKAKGSGTLNNVFIYAPDSHIEWNNANAGDIIGSMIGKTVKLFNHTKIEYNPDMANDVELDITGSGVTYSGYVWMD